MVIGRSLVRIFLKLFFEFELLFEIVEELEFVRDMVEILKVVFL